MDCLIRIKNEQSLREQMKCRATIEHYQLISLQEFRFTVAFKNACQSYVSRYCSVAKTKPQVSVFALKIFSAVNSNSDHLLLLQTLIYVYDQNITRDIFRETIVSVILRTFNWKVYQRLESMIQYLHILENMCLMYSFQLILGGARGWNVGCPFSIITSLLAIKIFTGKSHIQCSFSLLKHWNSSIHWN